MGKNLRSLLAREGLVPTRKAANNTRRLGKAIKGILDKGLSESKHLVRQDMAALVATGREMGDSMSQKDQRSFESLESLLVQLDHIHNLIQKTIAS